MWLTVCLSKGHPVVAIHRVKPLLPVISSKQKPRKCTMIGSDGREYTYLLKGHEDLRQDERVMQLFGLVNSCLANDRECTRRDLQIVRYAVMPLSPSSGLIEWVPYCDTVSRSTVHQRSSHIQAHRFPERHSGLSSEDPR
jgi:FKBP12-rapamycin complex-associated protein